MSAVQLSQVTVELDAVLTDTSNNPPTPIANESISFSYKLSTDSTYTSYGSATTNSSGLALVQIPNLLAPDAYDFIATFNGDAAANLSASTMMVVYDTSQSTLTTNITEIITPASPGPTDTLTVSGVLTSTPSGGGSTPLPSQPVMISVDGSLLITIQTQADGSYIYSGIPAFVAGSTHTITVTFPGATGYNLVAHQSTITISGGGPPALKPVNIVVVGIVATMFGLLATIGFLSRGSSRKK